jgi:hypothetical protein
MNASKALATSCLAEANPKLCNTKRERESVRKDIKKNPAKYVFFHSEIIKLFLQEKKSGNTYNFIMTNTPVISNTHLQKANSIEAIASVCSLVVIAVSAFQELSRTNSGYSPYNTQSLMNLSN